MAKNSLVDYNWRVNYDALEDLDSTTGSKLNSLQKSISSLGLRKDRYAETIRQALRDGRLKEQEINSSLQDQLKNVLERMSAKGLGKSGATAMLSGQLEKEAAAARKKATTATADAISAAQSQIKQINAEQSISQQELRRLLGQL